MNNQKILIMGGAGFIGSHLVDALVKKGYKVRIFDNLYEQIHSGGKKPDYLNTKAQFYKGDVTNKKEISRALEGIDAVFHLAAAVGVGQSMYEIAHYVKVNCFGTACLLDVIVNDKRNRVKKIIVAASMSSYGEGLYRCTSCGVVRPTLRSNQRLSRGDWQVYCPNCNHAVKPVATGEDALQNCNSIYAATKKNQEEQTLIIGNAYGIPAVVLRYFNVYGPRQSLSNPYNGVVAIFMSRLKNDKPPIINEDGFQTRDFIHIADVTEANILALEKSGADYQIFNVGSGKPTTIIEIAQVLAKLYKKNIEPDVSGKFRKMDVRHCFADISRIKEKLGFQPKIDLEDGLQDVIHWAKKQEAIDNLDRALGELSKKGLR